MILAAWPRIFCPLHPLSAKLSRNSSSSLLRPLPSPYTNSKCNSKADLKCCCLKNDIKEQAVKGFCVLPSDVPWASESVWSTIAFYMFNLHIPLGYGGLSIAAYVLNRPLLDPQTQALSLLVFQMFELSGVLFLLSRSIRPHYDPVTFFTASKLPKERNWVLASALGFGFLVLVVFLTLLVADRLFGAKAASNSIMKEILLSSNISKTACVVVSCIVTPLMEETVYRGFLLTSLASTLKWQHAVVISSAIFSAAHFSVDNFPQLFVIGCVLGCTYCWSGNLSSSIVVHSLYNALILIMTVLS